MRPCAGAAVGQPAVGAVSLAHSSKGPRSRVPRRAAARPPASRPVPCRPAARGRVAIQRCARRSGSSTDPQGRRTLQPLPRALSSRSSSPAFVAAPTRSGIGVRRWPHAGLIYLTSRTFQQDRSSVGSIVSSLLAPRSSRFMAPAPSCAVPDPSPSINAANNYRRNLAIFKPLPNSGTHATNIGR